MPTPKEIFDDPLRYLDFLQSANFEGQWFDWKEARVDNPSQIRKLKRSIKECISAFANSNREGGLIVLGVTDDGIITGIQHVSEQTMNNLLQVTLDLKYHATQLRKVELQDSKKNQLYFFYVPWTPNAICETVDSSPKGWRRFGPQNLSLTDQDREQLKRDKRIIDFETRYCCPYDPDELDENVITEFKETFIKERDASSDLSIRSILANIGAIIKDNDKYFFTNAGYLFFASNPHSRLAGAFVRVLRYDVSDEDLKNCGNITLEKEFYGSLPNIIHNLRSFLNESTFIQNFDKPEYPFLAVFEVFINAVIHRDYAFTSPILCSAYTDRLVVKNPGGFLQGVPPRFSLADMTLDPERRNPKLVDWMRLMKDEHGAIFVRSLSEGTRRMLEEMQKAGLPAPYYETSRNTAVTLYNRSTM